MRNKAKSMFVTSFLVFALAVPVARAKDAVNFKLLTSIDVGGKVIGPGNCQITWVSHSPETDVSFFVRGKVVAEAHGKMVERDTKSEGDTLVTVKDSNGNEILKEIRFAGKKNVLVLD
jgi:hypothetical protein